MALSQNLADREAPALFLRSFPEGPGLEQQSPLTPGSAGTTHCSSIIHLQLRK